MDVFCISAAVSALWYSQMPSVFKHVNKTYVREQMKMQAMNLTVG
jgi:hypothetical protein